MTGPVLSRAEQRAFVLALADVPEHLWWTHVVKRHMPTPVFGLVMHAAGREASGHHEEARECLIAAADLLRPRWTREEAEEALEDVHSAFMGQHPVTGWPDRHLAREQSAMRHEHVVRMITGEEP